MVSRWFLEELMNDAMEKMDDKSIDFETRRRARARFGVIQKRLSAIVGDEEDDYASGRANLIGYSEI